MSRRRKKPKLPVHIGHYEVQTILDMVELTNKTVRKAFEVNGVTYQINCSSTRMQTFKLKGTKCVKCGKEGTHFKVTFPYNWENKQNLIPHFSLFTPEGELMTHDHILPTSMGGPDHLNNTQPMCHTCNNEKGNSLPWKADTEKERKKLFSLPQKLNG